MLIVSDLVLIPIVPSPADLWAAVGIQELIHRIQASNHSLKARIVMNMCQANINLNQEVLKQINTFGIDVIKSSLHLRTAYRQSAVLGRTVFDIPGADKACSEIKMLKEEVIKILSV